MKLSIAAIHGDEAAKISPFFGRSNVFGCYLLLAILLNKLCFKPYKFFVLIYLYQAV